MVIRTRAPRELRKAFEIDGICVLASIYAIDDASVDVWLDADVDLSAATCEAAYERVAFFLSLPDDVTFATAFEATCGAIFAERLPVSDAGRLKDRMRERFGASITRSTIVYQAFPSAERLERAGDAELAVIGLPAQRIRYLRSTIDAFARIDERRLRSAPVDQVDAWLRAIAGIGRYSRKLARVLTASHESERPTGRRSRTYEEAFGSSVIDLISGANRFREAIECHDSHSSTPV